MRYAVARFEQEQKALAYCVYVTDALRCAAMGQYPKMRFLDILNMKQQDTRTGEQIAVDVIRRIAS